MRHVGADAQGAGELNERPAIDGRKSTGLAFSGATILMIRRRRGETMRKLFCLIFAAASLTSVALPTMSADAREVCRRVCDAYGDCERRCVWVRDGDSDWERDRGRRRGNDSGYEEPPPQRRTAPPPVVTRPPSPPPGPPAVQTRPTGGPKQGPAGPAAGGGACVASGFAKLSRNCSTNVGGCQRMPESCSRGWCCP